MSKPLEILLLEDDEQYLSVLKEQLDTGGLGSKITLVGTEDEFLKEIGDQNHEYDVLLSGHKPPGLDGLKALNIFRKKYVDTPFIIVADEMGEEAVIAAIEQGATDYVFKVNLKRLPVIIKRSLSDSDLKKRLRESEIKYKQFIETLPATIFSSDIQGNIHFVNPYGLKEFGYTVEDIAHGLNVFDIIHPEDKLRLTQNLTQLVSTHQILSDDYRLLNRLGETLDVTVTTNSLLTSGGQIELHSVVINNTERRRMETDVIASRDLLQRVIDILPVRVFWKDTHLHYLGCNTIFAQDAGLASPADLIGKNDFQMGWKEQAEKYQKDDRVVIESGESSLDFEELQTTPQGNKIWIKTSKVPLTNPQGGILGILGTYEDITARKSAEEALLLRDSQFKKLSLHVPGMIYQFEKKIDETYRVPFTSEAISDIFDCSPQDVLEDFSPITKRILPEDLDRVVKSIEYSAKNLTPWQCEYRIQIPEKPIKWLFGHSSPEKSDNGSIMWYGFNADITEHKKAEEELLHTQRMEGIGNIATGIAHDFNNVLGVVLGYANLLERQTSSESTRESLEKIIIAVKRGADMVKQIMIFAHKGDIDYVTMDLRHILKDSADYVTEATKSLESRGVHYKVISSLEKTSNVIADIGQMKQVLDNLLTNAIHAMPRGGTVSICSNNVSIATPLVLRNTTVLPGDYVHFSITDTGSGITEEVYNKMFEPFFTTKPKGRGTGLGLASVKSIIEKHNGYINVETKLGEGTTFEFYIRAVSQEETLPAVVSIDDIVGEGKILIVDDNEPYLAVLKLSLDMKGYSTLIARSYDEATAILKENKDIDLLLTDIHMIGRSGIELAQSLTGKKVCVVGMTGLIDEDTREAWPQEYTLLQKPISMDELNSTIRTVLSANNG
jgi:PAS domain S-box-containing protein